MKNGKKDKKKHKKALILDLCDFCEISDTGTTPLRTVFGGWGGDFGRSRWYLRYLFI